jgi:hypothetical protein
LLDKGFGKGQIVLSDTLSSGKYLIRVYTSWMRNFLPENCFMKQLKIYNSLSSKNLPDRLYSESFSDKDRRAGGFDENNKTGLTLSVNNLKADSIEIMINYDTKFLSENGIKVYLFIETHGIINHVSTENIVSGRTEISVPRNELIPGINHITVFDSNGKPMVERYIYSPVKENRFLKITPVDSCSRRGKVSIGIDIANSLTGLADSINLSVTVAPQTNGTKEIDIYEYILFGTEFGSQPFQYLKRGNISKLPVETVDSLLLNVKSNWLDWSKILSGNQGHFKYKMETENHFLLGKLLTKDQNEASPNEIVLLCTPGKDGGFQYTRTDKDGNFSFRIHIDDVVKDLVIMPDNGNANYKIIIESSFSDQYLHSEPPAISAKNIIPSYISDWSVNYQVRKIYSVPTIGSQMNPINQLLKPLRFYGKPDIELIMGDYIKLPVMEEVFIELLPRVSLKKKKSVYEISIADRVDDNRYVTSPSLLIDGVIVKDPSLIVNLDPDIVEKIDVIKGKYLVGDYFFQGLVNVITKAGDFSCIPLPDYMIRIPYKVIDAGFCFSSPDYSNTEIKKSKIPDFRNTLYWNPSVRPDQNGKVNIEFWTSDVIAEYEINIQGITKGGKLVSARKSINIK